MLAGVTLTFMKRTCVHDLLQALDNSKTFYKYHKDINQIEIGDVTIVLQAIEDPSSIYGLNCLTSDTRVIVRREGKVRKVRINKVLIGDEVITRKGWKPVSAVLDRGMKKVQKVKYGKYSVHCTSDHRIFDVTSNSFTSVSSLTNMSKCATLGSEVNEWNRLNELQTRLCLLTEFITICRSQGIMNVHQTIARKVMEACIEMSTWLALVKYQKGISFITKTTIELIMKLATLFALKILHTEKITGLTQNAKKDSERLQKSVFAQRLMSTNAKFVEVCLNLALLAANTVQKFALKKQEIKNAENRESYNALKKNVLYVVRSSLQKAEVLLRKDSVRLNVRKQTRRGGIKKDTLVVGSLLTQGLVRFVENLSLLITVAQQHAHSTVPTLSVGKLSRKEKHVYDISVEDEHEFYGNGILLHNCSCIYVDELDELPAEIAMEAVRSLNERLRQQLVDERPPYAKWTTTSQGLKGLYQTVMQFKASGIPYMIIRARTRDNIYLPKEYVDSMYAMYNEKERRCFLEGEFLSVDSGLVFPDYDPAKNDLTVDLYDSLQPDDVVYVSQDFNQNNNNAQAFIVKKGAIIMIKDYIFPDIRRSPEVLRYDFPEQKIVWIPDMTYKEHFGEFKKELRQYKIFIAYRACNPNVTDRNFAVNKCLYSERLFICPCCEDSKKSLMTHQIDPKTMKPMKGGIGAPDHKSDCLGMAVHYLLTWHKDMKDIYKLTLGRRYLYRDDPSVRLGNQVVAADRIMRGKITEDNDEGEIAV